ncbi:glycosyl hydrolase family 61-domain-containing protein [Fomes fomentarius]|nr:glycosyl hydrolase family 61-domain-containing protein [Fomes fomentarius]
MRSATILVASCLAFIPNVLGHGYLHSVAIDGKTYQGNVPNNPTVDSPIRLIDDVDPVKGTSNPNLSCGQNAQNAALVVPANPGSKVTFAWANGGGGNWPHNTGPMLTYMAACQGTTCDKFDASDAKWFKIDQAGQKSDGSGWVQADLMSGGTYSVTLPEDIEPGDYLIRHELIALQIAVSLGGAEFYPSCTQVHVGGSGSGVPNATVSFPGAYQDSEPGILTPDVYNPGFAYVFPGPPSHRSSMPATETTLPVTRPPPLCQRPLSLPLPFQHRRTLRPRSSQPRRVLFPTRRPFQLFPTQQAHRVRDRSPTLQLHLQVQQLTALTAARTLSTTTTITTSTGLGR